LYAYYSTVTRLQTFVKADAPMLQDLTRLAIAVPEIFPEMATKPVALDLDECSLDNLAALADHAYRAGDQALAEHCVRRLYALHDRKAGDRRAGRQQQTR